ncbi:unnamed protein product [Pleuronectes platessa]|uniref:Uncharacterized protein n=1 Tax=Pleuronectes platessa TaxID=8262 RepID=A0A9N7V4Y2_PLEPL|nr:unnamed protein product [Pleuronectes platessa]
MRETAGPALCAISPHSVPHRTFDVSPLDFYHCSSGDPYSRYVHFLGPGSWSAWKKGNGVGVGGRGRTGTTEHRRRVEEDREEDDGGKSLDTLMQGNQCRGAKQPISLSDSVTESLRYLKDSKNSGSCTHNRDAT